MLCAVLDLPKPAANFHQPQPRDDSLPPEEQQAVPIVGVKAQVGVGVEAEATRSQRDRPRTPARQPVLPAVALVWRRCPPPYRPAGTGCGAQSAGQPAALARAPCVLD